MSLEIITLLKFVITIMIQLQLNMKYRTRLYQVLVQYSVNEGKLTWICKPISKNLQVAVTTQIKLQNKI